ncbi:hypothetical protein Tco_1214105 [Tanacetum coccineum]
MKPIRCVNSVEAPMVVETMDKIRPDDGVTVHEASASNLNKTNIDKPISNVDNDNQNITSMAKENVGSGKVGSPCIPNSNDATKRDSNAHMSRLDSHNKIVKVSSLTNEDKVLGADVALLVTPPKWVAAE